ncbi:helix-turn-helix transcriptional regulator [Spirillospora sp. NPDC029432]|uniref:helix-turn-helix transcriptional regulator n=1 Tax=Spirillospora sp. NPDC029432 TaxID=3154599 RepID=UPI0034547633
MPLRESLDPDHSLWDWIAVDLHFYRTRAGLSCAQLGRILKVNRQAVSNMEAGRHNLDTTKARILDELWDLNKHFQRLLLYARAGRDPDWFKAHVVYEQRASIIKIYEALVVPGLLQTESYARALLSANPSSLVDKQADLRMGRQAILTKEGAPNLWVILSQNVLEWPVGGDAVMRGQLGRLLELSQLPNVVIRVLPRSVGAHLALDGSFKVITVREGDVVYMEACGGGRTTQDPADVADRRLRFDLIGADALTRGLSEALIRQTMEQYA